MSSGFLEKFDNKRMEILTFASLLGCYACAYGVVCFWKLILNFRGINVAWKRESTKINISQIILEIIFPE